MYLCWCACVGVPVLVYLCWYTCVGVPVLVCWRWLYSLTRGKCSTLTITSGVAETSLVMVLLGRSMWAMTGYDSSAHNGFALL